MLARTILAAMLACGLIGLAALVSAFFGELPDPPLTLTLPELPNGVSAHRIQDQGIYLKRSGREVVGFLSASPHLAMPLMWCPVEQVFVGFGHGELFDSDGRAIDGPTPRGMDQVEVTVDDKLAVAVNPTKISPGGPKVLYEGRTSFVSQMTLDALWTEGFCRGGFRPPS